MGSTSESRAIAPFVMNKSDNFYDIVILLCASFLNEKGAFDELSPDSSYLGGPVRMRAAVDIKSKVRKFIVVGGGIEKNNDKEKWRKVNDMYNYLIDNGIDSDKIIRIVSEADTHGNFRAIYVCAKEILKNKRVGILTNFYHLPRALRFAKDTFVDIKDISFIPISAESVVKNIKPTYLNYWPEFLVRIFNEIKGLNDWERREYRGQDRPSSDWRGECHLEDKTKLKDK